MKRLFIALWPDKQIRKKIHEINLSIRSTGLKKIKSDNLHVTLIFLGQLDAEAEILIRKSINNIRVQPFTLSFDQLAFWRKPRILCLIAEQYDQQLLILVDALKGELEKCGLAMEDRPYRPHITLARKAHKLIDKDFQPIEWLAQSFCLVEPLSTPDGVHYQVLQRWDFKEPGFNVTRNE